MIFGSCATSGNSHNRECYVDQLLVPRLVGPAWKIASDVLRFVASPRLEDCLIGASRLRRMDRILGVRTSSDALDEPPQHDCVYLK